MPSTTSYLTVFRKRLKIDENGTGNDESLTGGNIDRISNNATRNTAELTVLHVGGKSVPREIMYELKITNRYTEISFRPTQVFYIPFKTVMN